MKIGKDTVVTMHYKVVNAQGQLLDKAQEPTAYLHGGYENTLPKIEEALEGQEVGFETTMKLAAADAFQHVAPCPHAERCAYRGYNTLRPGNSTVALRLPWLRYSAAG